MKWIDCKDRMPGHKSKYLVFSKFLGKPMIEVVWLETHHGIRWLEPKSREEYTPIVTHWMPLPSLPNE